MSKKNYVIGLLIVALIVIFSTGCKTAEEEETQTPYIVSSTPANNATGVSVNLNQVIIVFSKAMKPAYSLSTNRYVDDNNFTWESVTVLKFTINTPLLAGTNYIYTLNPSGSPQNFKSTDDIPLATDTKISFTTE